MLFLRSSFAAILAFNLVGNSSAVNMKSKTNDSKTNPPALTWLQKIKTCFEGFNNFSGPPRPKFNFVNVVLYPLEGEGNPGPSPIGKPFRLPTYNIGYNIISLRGQKRLLDQVLDEAKEAATSASLYQNPKTHYVEVLALDPSGYEAESENANSCGESNSCGDQSCLVKLTPEKLGETLRKACNDHNSDTNPTNPETNLGPKLNLFIRVNERGVGVDSQFCNAEMSQAITNRDVYRVKELLDSYGCQANGSDDSGWPFVHQATYQASINFKVETFVARDTMSYQDIDWDKHKNTLTILKLLIENGTNVDAPAPAELASDTETRYKFNTYHPTALGYAVKRLYHELGTYNGTRDHHKKIEFVIGVVRILFREGNANPKSKGENGDFKFSPLEYWNTFVPGESWRQDVKEQFRGKNFDTVF